MSAILVSEYYGNLRSALADFGTGGVFMWKDESLAGALQTVVQTGFGPRLVTLNEAKTHFDPAPDTPDARGYLVFQAALLLIGGQVPMGFKTRALQVRIDPLERTLTVDYLRRQIRRLEAQGDPHGTGGSACFGIWMDMENALDRTTDPERLV